MSTKTFVCAMCLPMLFAISQAGCGGPDVQGPPAAEVQGVVTLDGQPLQQGYVRFVPIEGTPGPKITVDISEGRFAADAVHGPTVGTHRIEIESTDDGGYAIDDEQALERLKESHAQRIQVVRVPTIYNSSSTLSERVTAEGPNEFDFQLTTPKGQRR